MTDDHLSNETGLAVAISETGLDLKAKSRAVSAIDRLLGGIFDHFNPNIERPAQRKRKAADREDRLEEAITQKMVEAVHADAEIGRRALSQHYAAIGRKYENKAAVVTLALEDLRDNPPSQSQSAEGAESIDPAFANSFESYAEGADSDGLRERWARVLAGEVRQPGTFSARVLRIVDEMDPETAKLFEGFVQSRFGNNIPMGLSGELAFLDRANLVDAGLLVEPGMDGQRRFSVAARDSSGFELNVLHLGPDRAIGFAKPISISDPQNGFVRFDEPGKPALRVYVLTKAGEAIASLVSTDRDAVFDRLYEEISATVSSGEVRQYFAVGGGQLQVRRTVQKP